MKTLAHEHDKTEILRRLRTLHPGCVRRWGRMSVHQTISHLADAWQMAMGQRPVADESSAFARTVLKWMVLYAPLRWPADIRTCAEIDAERGGTRPAEFAADLVKLEALVELATRGRNGREWQNHPLFGRMSEAAWLRWGYRHMDHHLRQFGR